MKRTLLFALLLSGLTASAQTNTFPTTGNVGIGTTSPGLKLHLFKNTGGDYNPLIRLQDGLNDGYVMLQFQGTGRTFHIGVGNNGESFFGLANKFFLWDQDAATPRMVLDANGNFGFGTTTPGNRLSIAGATADASGLQFTQLNNASPAGFGNGKVLSLDANGNVILVNDAVSPPPNSWSLTGNLGTNPATNFIGTLEAQPLIFKTNGVQYMRLTEGGNLLVAPGTDNGDRLQVNGNIWTSNNVTANGNVIANGNIVTNGFTMTTGAAYGYVFTSGITGDAIWRPVSSLAWSNSGNAEAGTFGTTINAAIPIVTNSILRMWIGADGNVGIGNNTTPTAQFHTTGTVRFAGVANDNTQTRVLVGDADGNLFYRDASTLGGSLSSVWSYGGNTVGSVTNIGTLDDKDLPFITNNTERMRIGANGSVGIGTAGISDPAYKFFVEGAVRARKVRVDQSTWSDYVFYPDYYLRPLKEVEQYIQLHKHLPEVPSAAEVEKEGIDLGDNQATLLKKIEELTLYIIRQQKQLQEQQKRIEALEKKSLPEKRSK